MIGNFFGGSTSIGIDTLWHLDRNNGDNGVYIIDGWEIVNRYYFDGQEQDCYDLEGMLIEIDKRMPASEQISEFLKAEKKPIEEIKVGDEIVFIDWNGKETTAKIVGIGDDRLVNGREVAGVPYMDLYSRGNPADNLNNYLWNPKQEYRVKKPSAPAKVTEDLSEN